MIELSDSDMIGKGLHRECFAHPDHPGRCIKIIVNGDSDENTREAKYLRFLESQGGALDMLTRYHGRIETNRGEGAVFDLVRDFDGGVSKTLAHYLENPELTARYTDALRAGLSDLLSYLLANRVITMTIKPKNILFQRSGEHSGKLVVVDNIGNSDFIPLANYIPAIARAKIKRKWTRFVDSLLKLYSDNPVLAQILD